MLKKILALSVLMLVIFANVGECSMPGIVKIKIEQVTKMYITKFSMEHYREVIDGNEVYTKGRIIFNGDGIWRDFYAILKTGSNDLLRLEIDDNIIYVK